MYEVAVMMSSYNGEKYIAQQIESILNQNNVNVKLYIRDDGSTDDTIKIIKSFADKVELFIDKNVGLKNSFASLIWEKDINSEYYAFADQDDVWDTDKLATAMESLANIDGAGMYASNQRVVDAELNYLQPLYGNEDNCLPFPEYKNFKDFFLHGNYFGNTIVLNADAMSLIRNYQPENMAVQHDTWVAILVYLFGTIIFDPTMHSSYRQHGKNAVGGLVTSSSVLKKLETVINKQPIYADFARLLINGHKRDLKTEDLEWLELVENSNKVPAKIKLFLDKQVKGKTFYKTAVLKTLIIFSKF